MTCSSYLHKYVTVGIVELSISINVGDPWRHKHIHPVCPHLWLWENTDSCVAKKQCCSFMKRHHCARRGASSIDNTGEEQMQPPQHNGLWQHGITASAAEKWLFYSFAPGNCNKRVGHILNNSTDKDAKGRNEAEQHLDWSVTPPISSQPMEEQQTGRGVSSAGRDDSCTNRGMWYSGLWTLLKTTSTLEEPVPCRSELHAHTCEPCAEARRTAVRQAAGERWVESWGRRSIIDGVTHLRRDDRRRVGRQQTTNAPARCWALTLLRRVIAVRPGRAPSRHIHGPVISEKGCDATLWSHSSWNRRHILCVFQHRSDR